MQIRAHSEIRQDGLPDTQKAVEIIYEEIQLDRLQLEQLRQYKRIESGYRKTASPTMIAS
jgi:hypothetical protein